MAKKHEKKRTRRLMTILSVEILLAVALFAILSVVFPNNPVNRALASITSSDCDVILDPGHGGYDSGSVYGELHEKDITLAITKKVGAALQNKGVKVAYTRSSDQVSWPSDESSDLEQRVTIANNSKAKLFVSIHTNASEAGNGAYGFEIWGKIKKEETFALAKHVMQQLQDLQYTQNRGIKDQDLNPLHVLQQNKLPAILIEVGFLEHEQDRSYLTNEAAQQRIAEAIAQGIYEDLQSET